MSKVIDNLIEFTIFVVVILAITGFFNLIGLTSVGLLIAFIYIWFYACSLHDRTPKPPVPL